MFLILQTTDTAFISADRGREYDDLDDARAAAIEASLEIAREEIRSGRDSVAVEAVLKTPGGDIQARLVTAVSVAALCAGDKG